MTGLPPLVDGGDHETVALALPAAAVTPLGALGAVAGVTAAEGVDDGPVPTAFVAVTVNVYDVPFDSPVTVAERAEPMTDAVAVPGEALTV